jgi:hypothetical protein
MGTANLVAMYLTPRPVSNRGNRTHLFACLAAGTPLEPFPLPSNGLGFLDRVVFPS